MHITIEEAISLLDVWRTQETVLDIHFSCAGNRRELHETVVGIKGGVVNLSGAEGATRLDLTGAEFNGDRRCPPNSNHGAYLVCEYANGDRWSFYAPRPFDFEPRIPPVERRRR
jgi:hypothetical protein